MLRTLIVTAGIAAAAFGTAQVAYAAPDSSGPTDYSQSSSDTYYKNCAAARQAGAAPIMQGQPGYRSGLDRDGDGIACE